MAGSQGPCRALEGPQSAPGWWAGSLFPVLCARPGSDSSVSAGHIWSGAALLEACCVAGAGALQGVAGVVVAVPSAPQYLPHGAATGPVPVAFGVTEPGVGLSTGCGWPDAKSRHALACAASSAFGSVRVQTGHLS